MILNIEIITSLSEPTAFFLKKNKVLINSDAFLSESFKMKFTFSEPIISLRDHDYLWKAPYENYNAGVFAPKLLKLKNNYYIQANQAIGSWRLDINEDNVLYWCFNEINQNPITQYVGESNSRLINSLTEEIEVGKLSLLFSKSHGIEYSRSIVPFSGIICFTDHCDFDSFESLETLREFFKKMSIRTTKGFFLNHFSKRAENASYENEKEELQKWERDGHEMAYHSLTQSLRSQTEAFKEFELFKPEFSSKTWIDHGYQPYNLSLSSQFKESYNYTIDSLQSKGVSYFWSYIDSGFATNGVINQLNPNQFTLKVFNKGIKKFVLKKRMALSIKNLMFHYDASSKQIDNYKSLASSLKKALKQKSLKHVFQLIQSAISIQKIFFTLLLKWKTTSKTVYPLSEYTPIVFKLNKSVYAFQTLEMTDFVEGLSKNNINILLKESGLCILHTYFSVRLEYHEGKLLQDEHTINPHVISNFQYLSEQVLKNKLWNPTLRELIEYLKQFYSLKLDIDEEGAIFERSKTSLISRKV
ncbi:hypothetical protein DI383_02290 [Flavobacteriaceae bacterium LYZ1037]|nr:hypothetical protein DI383_02290 [Flavobacteriaceae bacterium LYZ1037]